jgi:hypothetical protein
MLSFHIYFSVCFCNSNPIFSQSLLKSSFPGNRAIAPSPHRCNPRTCRTPPKPPIVRTAKLQLLPGRCMLSLMFSGKISTIAQPDFIMSRLALCASSSLAAVAFSGIALCDVYTAPMVDKWADSNFSSSRLVQHSNMFNNLGALDRKHGSDLASGCNNASCRKYSEDMQLSRHGIKANRPFYTVVNPEDCNNSTCRLHIKAYQKSLQSRTTN